MQYFIVHYHVPGGTGMHTTQAHSPGDAIRRTTQLFPGATRCIAKLAPVFSPPQQENIMSKQPKTTKIWRVKVIPNNPIPKVHYLSAPTIEALMEYFRSVPHYVNGTIDSICPATQAEAQEHKKAAAKADSLSPAPALSAESLKVRRVLQLMLTVISDLHPYTLAKPTPHLLLALRNDIRELLEGQAEEVFKPYKAPTTATPKKRK